MPEQIICYITGITCYRHAGRKPVAMRAVPSYNQLADKVSKWEISGTIPAKARAGRTG